MTEQIELRTDGQSEDLRLIKIKRITMLISFSIRCAIDHFTVVCLAAWPLSESEAGVGLVLIETSRLFLRKFLIISMRTASLT